MDMGSYKPQIVAKLREKAASYDDCILSGMYLTWLSYGTIDAPICPTEVKKYLEDRFGSIKSGGTTCIVCRESLSFKLFGQAKRGRAEIETAHMEPRLHSPGNVGFAHRDCNIAQGNKTLPEFYKWIKGILVRVEHSS